MKNISGLSIGDRVEFTNNGCADRGRVIGYLTKEMVEELGTRPGGSDDSRFIGWALVMLDDPDNYCDSDFKRVTGACYVAKLHDNVKLIEAAWELVGVDELI